MNVYKESFFNSFGNDCIEQYSKSIHVYVKRSEVTKWIV